MRTGLTLKSSLLLQEHGSVLMEKHDRRSLSRESSLADIVEGIPPTFAQRPQTKICEEGKFCQAISDSMYLTTMQFLVSGIGDL